MEQNNPYSGHQGQGSLYLDHGSHNQYPQPQHDFFPTSTPAFNNHPSHGHYGGAPTPMIDYPSHDMGHLPPLQSRNLPPAPPLPADDDVDTQLTAPLFPARPTQPPKPKKKTAKAANAEASTTAARTAKAANAEASTSAARTYTAAEAELLTQGAIRSQGGRQPGAKTYSGVEKHKLLDLAKEFAPTGGKAWIELAKVYNVWARGAGYVDRTDTSLKDKFDKLVKDAKKTAPSGVTERPLHNVMALEADDAINHKAGKRDHLDVDSSDSSDVEFIAQGPRISEDKKPAVTDKKSTAADKKPAANTGPKVIKQYKVDYDPKAEPGTSQDVKPRIRNGQLAAATETFGQIGNYFSTAATQERDTSRALNQLHLQHTASLEAQLQQLRTSYDRLQDNHRAEMMQLNQRIFDLQGRAMAAEAEIRFHSRASEQPRRRRRYDFDDDSYSPRRRRVPSSPIPAIPASSSSLAVPSSPTMPAPNDL